MSWNLFRIVESFFVLVEGGRVKLYAWFCLQVHFLKISNGYLKGFLKVVNSVMSYYGEGPIKGDVIGSISWRSFVSLRLFGFDAVRKCD